MEEKVDNQNQNNNNGQKTPKNSQVIVALVIVGIITFMVIMGLNQFISSKTTRKIPYSEFLEQLNNGNVEEVVIQTSRIVITLKNGGLIRYYTPYTNEDSKLVDRLDAA